MTKRKAALVYAGLACLSDKSDRSQPSAALKNDKEPPAETQLLIAWAMCWDPRDPASLPPARKHVEPSIGDLFKAITWID